MAYERKRPKRGPRAEERLFLLSLRAGPQRIEAGPLGRCLKKGWCAFVDEAATSGGAPRLVGLTAAGRTMLAQVCEPQAEEA